MQIVIALLPRAAFVIEPREDSVGADDDTDADDDIDTANDTDTANDANEDVNAATTDRVADDAEGVADGDARSEASRS